MKRLTTSSYIQKALKTHENDVIKPIYDKVEYVNARTKICIICPIHGEYYQLPFDHLNGKGCPYCCGKNKTTESFKKEIFELYGDRFDLSKIEYINAKTKVTVICKEHGEFEITPDNLLHGRGCPKCCKRNKPYSTEEFVEIAREINKDSIIYDEVDYKDIKTPITLICPIHGRFQQLPTNHLQGHGCPSCNGSILEKEIFEILKKFNIEFDKQKRFKWLKNKHVLTVDFYLPKLNIAIECQGIQHYQSVDFFGGDKTLFETIERDRIKHKLCNENNIQMIYVFNDDIELTKVNVDLYNETNSIHVSDFECFIKEKLDIR